MILKRELHTPLVLLLGRERKIRGEERRGDLERKARKGKAASELGKRFREREKERVFEDKKKKKKGARINKRIRYIHTYHVFLHLHLLLFGTYLSPEPKHNHNHNHNGPNPPRSKHILAYESLCCPVPDRPGGRRAYGYGDGYGEEPPRGG